MGSGDAVGSGDAAGSGDAVGSGDYQCKGSGRSSYINYMLERKSRIPHTAKKRTDQTTLSRMQDKNVY